jgi:hypothetical protein
MQYVWGRAKVYTGFRWRNLRERDHFEDPGVDGRIILRYIFRKWDVEVRIVSNWLKTETVASTCECGNKPSGSIKCGEFLD